MFVFNYCEVFGSCLFESRGEIGSENNWILILESNWLFHLLIRRVNSALSFVTGVLVRMFWVMYLPLERPLP